MSDSSHLPLLETATARQIVIGIWSTGSALFVMLLIAQSVARSYGDNTIVLWSWALSNFIPVLSLILTATNNDAFLSKNRGKSNIRRGYVIATALISLFYITLLLLTIAFQPLYFRFSEAMSLEEARGELLAISSFWLGPVQGIVIVLVCTTFFAGPDHS